MGTIRTIHILVAILVILMVSIPTMAEEALKEGRDYTCVDRTTKELPPQIKQHTVIDKSIEKVPLCSEGKVPKALIQDKYESVTDDTIFNIAQSNSTKETASCSSGLCYDWAYSYQDVNNVGIFAYITQHYPEMDAAKGVYSLASIGAGTPYSDRVEVGWRKRQGSVTTLFVSWWKDGKPQCFDGSYCGFVQYSIFNYPGMKLNPSDGIPYEIQYNPGYNGAVGDWWITYNNDPVGYYPGSLWNGQFRGASFVLYRGGVISNAQVTTTDMGNGLWSSNPLAAKIYGQEYEDYNGWQNAHTSKVTTSQNLYSVTSTGSNSMRYGGPGKTVTFDNVLKNPGFETVSGSLPQYWIKLQTGTMATFTYPATGRVGGKAVSVRYTTKENGKVALWQQTGLTVVSSKQYKLSGYMKLEGVTGGGTLPRFNGASIRVTWYTSSNVLIRTDVITKSGTIGWAKYEKTFTAPSNAAKATVAGDLFNAAGKVTFDDLSLVRVS